MEYRYLGHTGLKVSELCLGAMTFGWTTMQEDSTAIIDRFFEAGGNFIDTADVYTTGASETILGDWLKGKPRNQVVVATKARFAMGDGPNQVGLSRKYLLSAVEASLRRLQTTDHSPVPGTTWDARTPLEETLSTLDGLVKSGKVRYLGASNSRGGSCRRQSTPASGWAGKSFVCLQPLYNLLDRSTEWELIPVCLNEGVGVIP